MKYELLDHTADAKFRAYGKTIDEAFAHAVQAMTAIVVDPEKIGRSKTQTITIESKTLENLLFDMLDEILFLLDTEKFLPAVAEHLTITKNDGKFMLHATLKGDDARKHSGNLKAITYSDMIIEQQKNGTWMIQAVVDI